MKWQRVIYILMMLGLSATVIVGCGSLSSESSSGSLDSKVYTIVCSNDAEPFAIEKNGEYSGLDIDILAAIAKEEGFKYTLKKLEFNAIIPTLTSGQADAAIAGISITDRRRENMDFSDVYITSPHVIAVAKDNTTINKFEDIQGKTCAVQKGTIGDKLIADHEERYNLNMKYYDNYTEMVDAVASGKADFLMSDYPIVYYQIAIEKEEKVKIIIKSKRHYSEYAFAVEKGKNDELVRKFNDGLKKIKANGVYDKILNEYLPKE